MIKKILFGSTAVGDQGESDSALQLSEDIESSVAMTALLAGKV
jgi:hypothetical protein